METKVIRKNTGSTTVIMIIMMVLLVGLGGIITYTQSLNKKDNDKIEQVKEPVSKDEEPVEEVSNCDYEFVKEKYTDEEIESMIDALEEVHTGKGNIDRSTFTVSPVADSKYIFYFEYEFTVKQGAGGELGYGTKKNGQWSFDTGRIGTITSDEWYHEYADPIESACEAE